MEGFSDSKKKALEKVFDNYTNTVRLNVSRGSLQSLFQDLTKAAGESFMDRAAFDAKFTTILKSVDVPNKTPGDSFLDTADNVVLEADLREKELKETEDILAERLEEAKADTSTDGKVRIGRLKKAIKSAEQAKDRIVTARNRFKDSRDSYKKEVANARKTLRARRADPEHKAAAETTLRLPPTEIQESVSETLDEAGVVNTEINSFLEGKATTAPSSEQSADTETADEAAVQNRREIPKQPEPTESQTSTIPSPRRRRIQSFETPSSTRRRLPSLGTLRSRTRRASPPAPISIPEPTPPSTTDPTPISTADSTPVSTPTPAPVYKRLPPLPPIPKLPTRKFKEEPSSRVLFNPSTVKPKTGVFSKLLKEASEDAKKDVSTFARIPSLSAKVPSRVDARPPTPPPVRRKGGMRKKKLRSRRGGKQTNVRRTRRS
jgi:hypothetical protein